MRTHIKSFLLAKKFNNLIFCFFDNMPNSYLFARSLFMYFKVFCFHKIYINNDLKKIISVTNFQIKDFKKNKIFNKFIKDFFNKKDDIDFTYVFTKDIKKSIFCYIKIFLFIVLNILCGCLNRFIPKYNN